MHPCTHCRERAFNTQTKLKQHIANTPKCRQANKKAETRRRRQGRLAHGVERGLDITEHPMDVDMNVTSTLCQVDDLTVADEGTCIQDREIGTGTSQDQPVGHSARVEDVPDEDNLQPDPGHRYVEPFPLAAGEVIGLAETRFHEIREEQLESGQGRWGPFADKDQFELAEWLADCVGQGDADRFLKMPFVRL
jgi:hypothetical protein